MSSLKSFLTIAVMMGVSLFMAGCFFGPEEKQENTENQTVLEMYAEWGKEMEEPAAVREEDQNKQHLKSQIGYYYRTREAAPHVDSCGLIEKADNVYLYYEVVTDKPDEMDPEKLFTGRGEIEFKYPHSGATLLTLDPALITDIISWYGIGRDEYTWFPGLIDSVEASVEFADTDVGTIKPGLSRFWGKNISTSIALGQGDTGSFVLDSLDDANHTQYGEGRLSEAHGGENKNEAP